MRDHDIASMKSSLKRFAIVGFMWFIKAGAWDKKIVYSGKDSKYDLFVT